MHTHPEDLRKTQETAESALADLRAGKSPLPDYIDRAAEERSLLDILDACAALQRLLDRRSRRAG